MSKHTFKLEVTVHCQGDNEHVARDVARYEAALAVQECGSDNFEVGRVELASGFTPDELGDHLARRIATLEARRASTHSHAVADKHQARIDELGDLADALGIEVRISPAQVRAEAEEVE